MFFVRQLHNITHKIESVSALRSAFWHEFGDEVPEEGDFNVGFFEGKQQAKKRLVSRQDLDAMYSHFLGKQCISLWCDGKEPDCSSGEEKTAKKCDTHAQNKRSDREDELENVFQKLKQKHGSEYSGPQLRLWARMIIAITHEDIDNPPKVPMITGSVQRQPRKESLTDAFTSAASAIAKAFSPTQSSASPSSQLVKCSPSKTADIRMKNLEQIRVLQHLREGMGFLPKKSF